jgi:hypothetical protein
MAYIVRLRKYTHNRHVNPFPEDFELLSIFECAPEVLDTDIPWFYNTLTFRGKRDELNYLIKISPAYGCLEVRIGDPSQPITHLSITEVSALRLHEGHGEAVLMASFSPDSGRGILKIRLRPHLSIEWPFERK